MEQSSQKQADWPLLGNEHIVNYLAGILEGGKVGGSYIFLGPDDLGKTTLANYFAKSMLCEKKDNAPCGECPSCRQTKKLKTTTKRAEDVGEGFEVVHGDFHVVRKDDDKMNISIEQIRGLIEALSRSSFLNSYKIGIIKQAETLSMEASNALLKTLEEPRHKVVVIMIASDLESIPETIASRSQILNFYPIGTDAIYDHLVEHFNASRTDAANIAHLSLGRPALAVKLLEDKEFYEEYLRRARVFMDFFQQDLNARFSGIKKITGDQASSGALGREAVSILEIWRGVVRDLLLVVTNNRNLLQYKILGKELKKITAIVDIDSLLKISHRLNKGEKEVKANVNPRLVLEKIACNI